MVYWDGKKLSIGMERNAKYIVLLGICLLGWIEAQCTFGHLSSYLWEWNDAMSTSDLYTLAVKILHIYFMI